MFFCHLGKDRIIFVTREDHETPSNAELIAEDPDDPYEEQGQSFSLCAISRLANNGLSQIAQYQHI